MAHKYDVEYTDTFAGDATYSWLKRGTVTVPEWSHFKGWDGNGRREPKGYRTALMRRAKAFAGLTGVRGRVEEFGDVIAFYPRGMCTVLFITWAED